MDVPHIEHCSVCKQYVRMDQTQEECAREHQCHAEACPMRGYFHFVAGPDRPSSGPDAPDLPRK